MAESIPGGAFKTAADTWVNAEGKPLTKDQIADAEDLHAQQQADRESANLAFLEAQARNDPLARSLAHALSRPQVVAAPPSKHESPGVRSAPGKP